MKKLLLLWVVLLGGMSIIHAESPELHRNFRGNLNSFIFQDGGIEFAVFPDGQFDFNYLNDGPVLNVNFYNGISNISFNTGYSYDRYVQYDAYGAVIQIENTPIFYDSWGRVAQIGNIFINYRNGFVNRLGGLRVFYSSPGVVHHYAGFVNQFNRGYVYQPWHAYYAVPVVNRCVIFNRPYRQFYNPVRYSWAYHRNYWNVPTYYNGYVNRNNVRRSFYRPNDRVNYRSFERGRRNSRGIAVANSRAVVQDREAISRGRRNISRVAGVERANAQALSSRNRSDRNTRSTSGTRSNSRATATTRTMDIGNSRVASTRPASSRINENSPSRTTGRELTSRTAPRASGVASTRSTSRNNSAVNNGRTTTERAVRSNRNARTESVAATRRSTSPDARATSSRSSRTRATQPSRSSRAKTARTNGSGQKTAATRTANPRRR
ncbi:MAG: hypothetical protein WBA16_12495 [Nonlabens sp.]